jgi:ankyrin repeat protein
MRKKVQRRLIAAVMFGDASQVTDALRSQADPNLADRDHGTPLYEASVAGRTDIVRVLLRAGANPNAESTGVGSDGLPLCAAACWGHTETVQELIAGGASPSRREDHGEGRTASEWAARGGWAATRTVLQAAGG